MSELSDFNERVIKEFRANSGRVGGQMANTPLLLLTTTGAKSSLSLTRPLAYTKDGESIVVIASYAGAPKSSTMVSQFGCQPRRHPRTR
jgi:hypothetical protein